MSKNTSNTSNPTQKAMYPDEPVARWVEEMAELNDRSESYVISKIVEDVMWSVGGDAIVLPSYDISAEEK